MRLFYERGIKKYLWAIVLFFAAHLISGEEFQSFPIENYTIRNWDIFTGLNSDSIITVFQDSDRYIWIGTFEGVLRFDGREYLAIDETNTPGFRAHSAHTFIEAPDGSLWIGTSNEGLVHYEDGLFRTYKIEDGLLSNSVKSLAFDDMGRLWIGTNQGLLYLEDGIYHKRFEGNEKIFEGRQVNQLIYHSKLGLIATCSDGGLYYHVESKVSNEKSMSSFQISASEEMGDGDILLGTRSGHIFLLDGDGPEELEHLFLENNPIRSINRGEVGGTIWVAGDAGLMKLESPRSETVQFLQKSHSALHYIPKAVMEDHEGNLWLGTRSGGLYQLVPSSFTNYNIDTGLTNKSVNTAAEDHNGSFWIGADDGIYCLENGVFTTNPLTNLLSGVRVKHIQSNGETLYISTISQYGVIIYKNEKISFINENNGLPSLVVKKTLTASDGTLWISTSNGIIQFYNGAISRILNSATGFESDEIYDIYEDSRKRIWIGTVEDGLFRFREDGSYIQFGEEQGLSGEMVFSVYEDKNNFFWISTATGVFLMDDSDRIYPVRYKQGLPFLYVYNALPIGEDLWFTSIRGLSRASLKEAAETALGKRDRFSIETYSISDGLLASPNALSWPFRDSLKRIWIPVHKGISVYDIEQKESEGESISLHIDPPVIDGETLLDRGNLPLFRKEIGKIDLKFSALTFSFPQRYRYSYILEGYDTNWTIPGTSNAVSYRKLAPGKYDFKVRLLNNTGEICGFASLKWSVKPVFVQTLLFKIILIGVCIFSVGFLFYFRFKKTENKAKRLEDEVYRRTSELESLHESRLNLIADISHEIRTPLTIIDYGINRILEGRIGKTIENSDPVFLLIKRNYSRILITLNNLLNFFKLNQSNHHREYRRIIPSIYLQQYKNDFSIMADKKGISFILEIAGEEERDLVSDPILFESVLLNLLSNAFKFTPSGGMISIILNNTDDTNCIIEVIDTGQGISEEKQESVFKPYFQNIGDNLTQFGGIGLGLSLVRKALSDLDGNIELTSSIGHGTSFILQFPRKSHTSASESSCDTISDLSTDFAASLIPEEPEISAKINKSKPILLIVEDNSDLRRILYDELSEDFNIQSAENGRKALVFLEKKELPDIIVSDIMMPEMNGKELYHYVRHTLNLQGIPFLFLSARASEEERRDLLKEGGIDYIYKPFSPEILLYKVKNMVAMRRDTISNLKQKIGKNILRTLEMENDAVMSTHISTLDTQKKFALTDREFSIMNLVLMGKRDKEIALELDCAVSTVSNTLSRVYKKTKTDGRMDLVSLLARKV